KRMKITRTIKTRKLETTENETLIIDVKPGWKEGTKIKFANRGDVNVGREPADVVFVIKQKPHDIFKRIGNDLVTIITITQEEAVKGFQRKIKGLSGDDIVVSIKDGIPNSRYVHKISGKGMPIRK